MKDSLVCVYTDDKKSFYATIHYLAGQRLGIKGSDPKVVRTKLDELDGRLTAEQEEDIMTGLRDNLQ